MQKTPHNQHDKQNRGAERTNERTKIYEITVQRYSPAPVVTGLALLAPVASITMSFEAWLVERLQQLEPEPTSEFELGGSLFTVAGESSYNMEEAFLVPGTSIAGFLVKKSAGLKETW